MDERKKKMEQFSAALALLTIAEVFTGIGRAALASCFDF